MPVYTIIGKQSIFINMYGNLSLIQYLSFKVGKKSSVWDMDYISTLLFSLYIFEKCSYNSCNNSFINISFKS